MDENYSAMTGEQLESEQRSLHRQMKVCKAKKRAITQQLDNRAAVLEAERALARMSDSGRKALTQVIGNAGGIQSQAAVGTPGAK